VRDRREFLAEVAPVLRWCRCRRWRHRLHGDIGGRGHHCINGLHRGFSSERRRGFNDWRHNVAWAGTVRA
jgi:hypothetical protein